MDGFEAFREAIKPLRDLRPTEPAECTDLDDVVAFIEQAYAAKATLSELAVSLMGQNARPPVLEAITALEETIERLEMRRSYLDGSAAAEWAAE